MTSPCSRSAVVSPNRPICPRIYLRNAGGRLEGCHKKMLGQGVAYSTEVLTPYIVPTTGYSSYPAQGYNVHPPLITTVTYHDFVRSLPYYNLQSIMLDCTVLCNVLGPRLLRQQAKPLSSCVPKIVLVYRTCVFSTERHYGAGTRTGGASL